MVVSFDNHPDWDVRPPKWCCGGWVNRALELPQVRQVSVWGCGNFECWWPGRIFGNRAAERAGRLEVHPWGDDRPEKDRQRPATILRDDWREKFERFADKLGPVSIYVTIDLDCLRADEAVTNWENGQFSVSDVIWALQVLRNRGGLIAGGDICGAWSLPRYARWKQKFVSEIDHPKRANPDVVEMRRRNDASLAALWPELTD